MTKNVDKTPLLDKIEKEVESIDLEILQIQAGIKRTKSSYYIWGTYPPLIAMDGLDEGGLFKGNSQKAYDIYIHIPFCKHNCNYCHFYYVTESEKGELTPESEIVRGYLDALKEEISILRSKISGTGKIKARSIYIGGGTPSFFSSRQIQDLLSHIINNFETGSDREPITYTFDVHPKIFDEDNKLDILLKMGVNRISIGGLDMDNKVLACQNRGHTRRDIIHLIATSKLKGFHHVVTDLIMGVPGQNPISWGDTLRNLIEYEIDCIMTFPLMLKASAALSECYQRSPACFPSIKERMVLQLLAMDILAQSGYVQDPLFYFNRETEHINDQQKRKFGCIEESGLLAIGASSFGFLNGFQYYNTPCMMDYIAKITNGMLPVWKGARLNSRHLFERALIFGLRSGAIDKEGLKEKYGFDVDQLYPEIIDSLQECGLLTSKLELTRLGVLFADEISSKFAGEDIVKKAEQNADVISAKDMQQVLSFSPVGHRAFPKKSHDTESKKRRCKIPCSTCRC